MFSFVSGAGDADSAPESAFEKRAERRALKRVQYASAGCKQTEDAVVRFIQ
jgi:hypothetical protein